MNNRNGFATFFRLVRWPNLAIIVFTQYMARIFLIGPKAEWMWYIGEEKQLLISLSTVCIAAAGYIINDYFDVKIDLVNKPQQVIIGKTIPRRWAMLTHQFLNFSGIILGFWVHYKVAIINIIAATLLWFYAERFKRLAFIGNFLVAGLTGASLIIMAVYYNENDKIINIYAVFAFGITLIREIIKDMEDVKGDEKFGCKTLPIIWGIAKTKRLLYVFILLFMLTVILLGWQLHNTHVYLLFLLMGVPMSWLIVRLYYADRKSHFAFLSSYCKMIMLLGIATMIAV